MEGAVGYQSNAVHNVSGSYRDQLWCRIVDSGEEVMWDHVSRRVSYDVAVQVRIWTSPPLLLPGP